ncbi:sialic acid-binding Ig-like lectin 13 [Notolabrus celidotus]|uniref:sialic acid-binding Ig-like lectin 13 n=1 Tax=Notolabrus celidotus TaxID=1203425 RepID=UPI0014908710|nr:sialic acid-binding Ig-like lectin 13 [Notolabrus celidotus]
MMRVSVVLSVEMLPAYILLSAFSLSGAVATSRCGAHLFISTPQRMEALNGTCLLIPCNFSAKDGHEFDSTRETSGIWIKNDPDFQQNPHNVIFDSNRPHNTYPMNITGDLREKNCTTLFDNINTEYPDRYYFRIEHPSFRATANCDPVIIKIHGSPRSPRIEIPGDLKEEESVTITCSALTPCQHSPPKLTWSLQRDSLNNMEENTDGTFTTQIQRSITLSEHHDGYNITCSATYPVNEGSDVRTAEETKTLSVSYAPKNTSVSISPSGLVSAGTLVNLTCSSRAKPPVSRFTWFRISNNRPVNVSEGESYSLNVTEAGVYHCVATNYLGNQTSSSMPLTIIRVEVLPDSSLQWEAVVGGIFGIIVFICLLLLVWRFKSKGPSPQQTQIQTGEQMSAEEPAVKTEEEEEQQQHIHYGEIDFSKLRHEPSSDSVQDRGQQQDTVYAQVKVSETTNNQTQSADSTEGLYAEPSSAAAREPWASQALKASFFSLTASFPAGVHHRVLGLLPRQAPMAFKPQPLAATSAMDALNMAHLDSMSPTSPRMPMRNPSRGVFTVDHVGIEVPQKNHGVVQLGSLPEP